MANTQEQTNTFLGLGGAILSGLQGYKEGNKEASAEEDRKLNREAFKLRQKTAQKEYERNYTGAGQELYDKDTEFKLKVATEKLDKLETQAFMGHLSNGVKNWASSGGNADGIEDVRRQNPEFFNKLLGINVKNVANANYNSTNEDERKQIELAVSTLQQSDPKAAEELDSDPKTEGIQIDPEKFNKRFLKFSVLDDNGNLVTEYRDMLRLLQRNSGFTKYMSEEERKRTLELLKVKKAEADIGLVEAETLKANAQAGKYADIKEKQDKYDRLIKLPPEERGMTQEEFELLELQAYPKKATERGYIKRAEAAVDAANKKMTPADKEIQSVTNAENTLKAANINDITTLPEDKLSKYSKEINTLRKFNKINTKVIDENVPLVEAATGASQLKGRAVGGWDSLWRNSIDYISNQGADAAAIAKFETLKSTLRYRIFGATLTNNELKSSENVFGNLNKQYIPLMERMYAQLEAVKRSYDTDVAGKGYGYTLLWKAKAKKDYNDLIDAMNRTRVNIAKTKAYTDKTDYKEPELIKSYIGDVAPPKPAVKPKDEKLSILERLGLNKGK